MFNERYVAGVFDSALLSSHSVLYVLLLHSEVPYFQGQVCLYSKAHENSEIMVHIIDTTEAKTIFDVVNSQEYCRRRVTAKEVPMNLKILNSNRELGVGAGVANSVG